MRKYGIPTAEAEICTTRGEAEAAVKKIGLPCVFKAEGLASGKGVLIVVTKEEADRALKLFFDDRVFGSAADRVLVEQYIDGDEVSLMVLCDGERAIPLATVKDYKKVFDGDRGPNTGGMGSHSPSVILDAGTSREVLMGVVGPTLKGMKEEGRPFKASSSWVSSSRRASTPRSSSSTSASATPKRSPWSSAWRTTSFRTS
jgi:phosphoribosylamine--glycine ligase